MSINLIKLQDKETNEIYKIKRTSKKYIGLIEDILEDCNKMYKEYSDLVGLYLNDKIIKIEVFNENIIAVKCYEKGGFSITKKCDWNNTFVEMEITLWLN